MSNRIIYDISELAKFDKRTGIQRVTRAVLASLEESPPIGWEVTPVYGRDDGEYCYINKDKAKHTCYTKTDIKVNARNGDIFISVDLAFNINDRLKSKLINFKENGVLVYFVVYDLIPVRHPEWFVGTNAWFEGNDYLGLFNFWFETSLEVCDGLVCISNSVLEDVQSYINENTQLNEPPKLGYFHLGSDMASSKPSEGVSIEEKSILKRIYASQSFLMVGTVEPRKGHLYALDAFEGFWETENDILLVIVGKPGWLVDDLIKRINTHAELNKRLFWFNGVSDEFLEKLYRSSKALLALSEAEGFGLPLIEAGFNDLPIIARDLPVFREVSGCCTTFLKNCGVEEIQSTVLSHIENSCKVENKFVPNSWGQSTKQLFKVIGQMSSVEFKWMA